MSAGLLLAGTTGRTAAGSAPPSTAATAQTSEGTSGQSVSISPAPSDSTSGCPATSAHMPADVSARQTVDLDGDGEADTEWFDPSSMSFPQEFGITTASGATVSVQPDLGPTGADPRALTTTVDGQVIVLISGSRVVQLLTYLNCELQPVMNQEGEPYQFDLTGHNGNGVGCADVDGDGTDELVGLKVSDHWARLRRATP